MVADERTGSPRKRRRLLKISLAVVLLVAATAVALPIFGAPFARNVLIGRLERALHARATLDDFAFGLSGWARISGLRLEDLDQRPVLSLERAEVSLHLLPALKGRFEFELVLDGLVVHVRRDGEGRWNFATLPRAGEAHTRGRADAGDEALEPPPDVSGNLIVRNGRIVIHGREAETELRDFALEVALAGPGEPASLHLSAIVHGPTGPGGRITLDGWGALSPDASGAPSGAVSLTLDQLLLEALEPALAVALELEEGLPRDTISVEAELQLAGGELAIDRLEVTSTMVRGSVRGTVAGLFPADHVAPDQFAPDHVEPDHVEPDQFELDHVELRGPRFEGLTGEFVYVPDRIAPLLERWLPGELSGSEEETITFELNGAVGDLDPASVLAATRGWATVGFGRFRTEGFDMSGEIRLELDGGVAFLLGTIGANGGSMRLKAAVDLRGTEDSASWLEVNLDGVRANAELAPLLGRIHPLFAAANVLQASDLGGLISCSLRLAYDAPLELDALPASWAEVRKEHISGAGTFALSDVVLVGSPLLERIAAELGARPGEPMALDPIRFEIQNGRLTYGEPWRWTIGSARTTFSGSVGLDETLALRWTLPITEDLVRRHGFLKPLLGRSLEVPLEGTTRKPKLLFEGALSDLAQSALRAELADRVGAELGLGELEDITELDDLVDKVGDLLGGKAQAGGKEDAATLYKRAGDLWDKGEKQAAGALYERIRTEFKRSAVYLLHRKKIKKRAKEAP